MCVFHLLCCLSALRVLRVLFFSCCCCCCCWCECFFSLVSVSFHCCGQFLVHVCIWIWFVDVYRHYIRTKCLQKCVCVSFCADCQTGCLWAHAHSPKYYWLWLSTTQAFLLSLTRCAVYNFGILSYYKTVHQVAQPVTKSRTNRHLYSLYSETIYIHTTNIILMKLLA